MDKHHVARFVCLVLLVSMLLIPGGLQSVHGAQMPGDSLKTALQITSGRYLFDFYAEDQWFKIDLQFGQRINILLTVPSKASLDLYLYSSGTDGYTGLLASSEHWEYSGVGGTETISYVTKNSGLHYIKVRGVVYYAKPATYELKVFVSDFKAVSSYWGESSAKSSAFPGDSNVPLTIEVAHYASYVITGLTSTLQLIHPFSNTLKTDKAVSFYGGNLQQGGIVSFTFNLNIDSHAELKSYELTMLIDYYVKMGDDLVQAIPVVTSVEVPLHGRPEINILLDRDSLLAGQVNDLSLVLRNDGAGTATSIEGTLTLPSGVTIVNGSNQFQISRLEPGEEVSKRLAFRVTEGLASSNTQLNVQISYKDLYAQSHSESKLVELLTRTPPPSDLEVSESIYASYTHVLTAPGGNAKFPVVLTNPFDALQNVDLSVDVPNGWNYSVLSGSTYVLGLSLVAKQRCELQVSVGVPSVAEDGVYGLMFTAHFRGFDLTLPLKVTVSRAIASEVSEVQIELNTSNPYQEAYGGRAVKYALIVKNNADESELVDLAMNGLPENFTASFRDINDQDIHRIYVDAGSQASISLVVAIPETATLGTVQINVTATAGGGSATLPLTLEVVGKYSLSVQTQNLFTSVTVGSTGTFSIAAQNDGTQYLTNVMVTVSADLVPGGMEITLSPTSIAILKTGDVATFIFKITSDSVLNAGTYLVPFTLSSNQVQSSQYILTVQAVQSSNIILIGAVVAIAGIVALVVVFRRFGRR